MKLYKYALLCAAIGLVLLACNKKPLPGQKSAKSAEQAASETWDGQNYVAEEGASLKLWYDNEDVLLDIVAEWEQAYPDIPLESEVIGTVDARAKMVLDGPAGLGADVFITPHNDIQISYQDGILLPMGQYHDRIANEFNEEAAKIGLIDGKYYMIPWTLENIALFWNKDLYPGDPPATWDEIIAFAKEYNEPKSNKWAVRWEVNNSYIDYFFLTAYGFRLFSGDSSDPSNPGWDSPEVIEGLQYFQNLRQIFDVDANDVTGEFTTTEFAKGTVPLTITGPWSIQSYKEAGINFGVTKIPMLPGNRQPYTFSGAQVINVSSYTQYPNAARLLAMFLNSDQVLSKLYETIGKLPAKKDTSNIPEIATDPYLNGILEQAPYSYPMPTIPEMAFAWEPQRTLFYYTWNRELSPEEAVRKATEDYETQQKSSSGS